LPKIKKIWVIVITIVLFLIITNPDLKRFREFRYGGTRKYNFFLFSIFEVPGIPEGSPRPVGARDWLPSDFSTKYYLGIVSNFIKLKEE